MKSLTKSLITAIASTTLSITSIATAASAMAGNSARSGLTKVNGVWTGDFYTSDVSTYSNTFTDPTTFRLTAGGETSKLTAESNYTGNYKWSSVILHNTSGSTTYASSPSSSANNTTVTATASYSGTLNDGEYYGFVNDGSGEGASYLERCLVYVYKD